MAPITDKPPRGGLREEFAGQRRDLLLPLGSIEQFEDARRGLLALQEDMHLPGRTPKMGEIADLLILGLIAGGMESEAATKAVQGALPMDARRQLSIARALVAVTLEPDLQDQLNGEDEDGDDPAEKPEGDGLTSGG